MLGGMQVMLVSIYAMCSVGVAGDAELLAPLPEILRAACPPFVIAGDLNFEAERFGRGSSLRAGFLHFLREYVVRSGEPAYIDVYLSFLLGPAGPSNLPLEGSGARV
ncbi:unnamed protein product [Prorocentrum cordatum]|uniref:Endonuclease/exonuclease/phosphatase domain-containing protein n=1 Tax=Prorocentrum cordatum TaxID=2364126 RepID=A0ABN9YK09_9DINO|nr:unnamed protein product [Polarella glacialis]